MEEKLEILKKYCERYNEFNIFKVLKMQSGSENRHSNFIAWLLDEKGTHGLEKKFFNAFISSVGITDLDNNKYYKIEREESCEVGRPDILIKNDNNEVVCVIEVKFGAKETNNQCKRYFEKYSYNCKYIFLDIDDRCYDELENKYERDKNFDFSVYKLATFKDNILNILKGIKVENENVKSILDQYIDLLEEKYYIIPKEEIQACINILDNDMKIDYYSQAPQENEPIHSVLHNFIWHTVPNRYNEILLKVIKDLDLKILLKWIENGSSLSLRCWKTNDKNYDFHNNPHIYIDHRNNNIILYFQDDINKATKEKEKRIIVNQDEYFSNMLLSNDKLKEIIKEKLNVQ